MTWIPEKEAAELVGRKPQALRKNVKSGKWEVPYSAINGRKYFYSVKGIEKLITNHSSLTKSTEK